MVTIKDIAKEAGVAHSTVSLALNNKPYVSHEVKTRVLKAAKKLDYRPNSSARSLKTQQTKNIGFVIEERYFSQSEPFYNQVFRGAEKEMRNDGYHVLLSMVTKEENEKVVLPHFLVEQKVDGLIVVGKIKDDFVLALRKNNSPLVLIDYFLRRDKIPSVVMDNIGGAYEGVTYLIEAGYRKIGFLGGLVDHPSIQDRFKGYKLSLEEAGLKYNEDLVQRDELEVSVECGCSAMNKLLNRIIPEAIFCANDAMAIGAMRAIKEKGLKIPEDMGVIGFDDVEWTEYSDPPLTTVRVFKEQMGQIAVKKLIDIINGKDNALKSIVGTELVIRESCRKAVVNAEGKGVTTA